MTVTLHFLILAQQSVMAFTKKEHSMKHAAGTGETICLNLPFNPTKEEIIATSGIGTACPSIHERIASLVNQGIEIARPVVFYKKAAIHRDEEGAIHIDSVPLEGTLPGQQLDESSEAAIFIASCGQELYNWQESLKDYFDVSVAGIVAERALQSAMKALFETMKAQCRKKYLAIMTPGSVPEWPLSEQEKIFQLLGDVAQEKGICLDASSTMVSTKTVSGILFSGDEKLETCSLCSFKDCSLRHSGFYSEPASDTVEKPCCV